MPTARQILADIATLTGAATDTTVTARLVTAQGAPPAEGVVWGNTVMPDDRVSFDSADGSVTLSLPPTTELQPEGLLWRLEWPDGGPLDISVPAGDPIDLEDLVGEPERILPLGGSTGQHLAKTSNDDADVGWVDPPAVPDSSAARPVTDGVGTAGTSVRWSRGDHQHPARPIVDSDLPNTVARTGQIPVPSTVPPPVDGTATAGTATVYARGDHTHPVRPLTDTDIPDSIARDSELPQPAATPPPVDGTAAAGTSGDYARADHTHPARTLTDGDIPATIARDSEIPVPSASPPLAAGTGTPGSDPEYSRGDHQHPARHIPEPTTTVPKVEGTAEVGSETTFARGDHRHPVRTIVDADIPASIARDSELPQPSEATPAAPGDAAAGTAVTYSRADHVHPPQNVPDAGPDPSDATPVNTSTASAGTSDEYARGDHDHGIDAGGVQLQTSGLPVGPGESADRGTGTTASRNDHQHPKQTILDTDIPASIARDSELPQPSTSTPVNTATARTGTSADYARGDHDHGIVSGSGGGGTSATGYNQSGTVAFTPVTTDVTVGNNGAWTVQLLAATYPSGIQAGVDFWTVYNGYLYLDVDTSTDYDISLEVEHSYTVDSTTTTFVSRRTVVERIGAGGRFTLPLNTFSSVSVVRLGEFTDSDGDTVTITQAMLDSPTTLTLRVKVARSNSQGFTLEAASVESGTVNFFQFAEPGSARSRQDTIDLLVGDTGGDVDFSRDGAGNTSNLRGTLRDGTVTVDKIADSNVTTAKLNQTAVTTGKLNDGAVTTDKLANNAVTAAKLADSIETAVGRIPSAPGGSDNNKVWKTDGSGNPGWRDDATSSGGGGEENVQSDWDVTDTTSDAYIKNKPTIPVVPARAGAFTAADETKLDGIEAGAQVNVGVEFTAADHTKLDGIEAGAEANPTDAEIGDKAFSNPPSDLSAAEQTAVRTAIGAGSGGGGSTVSAHTPAAGDEELAGLDIDGTDYEITDRESRNRLRQVEQRVHPILEKPQTWSNVTDSGVAGWTAATGLLTDVSAIAALTYANADVSGTVAEFIYVRILAGAQQSTYRFRYTVGGGAQNGQIHDRVLGTWSGERVGADSTWAYYRISFYEGDTFTTGRTQLGVGSFEWEGDLTRNAVEDQLDAIGVPAALTALKNVTRDLHLDGATRLVKNTAAATAGVARVAVANSALQAIEAGTQNLDVQGVTFTATLANAHFGTTATTTDEPVIRLAQTEDRSDWRILFDDIAFLAGGWVPINVSNGTAGYDYYISSKVARTTEIAFYKSTEETTYHGALADGLAIPPVTAGGGAAVTGIWRGTQTQYDAITSKNDNVLYLIEA
ncbi:MAG: hypothetical protein OXI18_11665 [bacterium]|nr:hypothetical protein [bacterium]